ncbi:hypothetical protein ACP4OV_010223 [Aristida adscensionis]
MAELLHGDSPAERPCLAPGRTSGEAEPPFSATCARASRDSSAASVHEDDTTFAEMELDMESNTINICLLLADPIEEKDLDLYLGGPLDDYAHQQSGNDFFSVSWDGAVEDEQAFADHRVEDYLEPSMLDLPKRRGQRCRRNTPWRVDINHLLDLVKPATKTRTNDVKPTGKSGKNDLVKPKKQKRKNKKHMTFQEVANLVKGASKHGAGNWKMVHDDYFQTSIRSQTDVKDKWRNLVKACKGRVKKPYLKTSRIIERFGDMILKLESEYAARKQQRPKARRRAS